MYQYCIVTETVLDAQNHTIHDDVFGKFEIGVTARHAHAMLMLRRVR